ncbi:MAG: rhomboid family intramembrane serine protease [Bacteroidota bacterium]
MNITLILLLVTVGLSMLAFSNPAVLDRMIFNPYRINRDREWYRFITSGFIHADWLHLLVNGFVLYSFGPIVEQFYDFNFGELSGFYFIALYFGAMVISIARSYKKHLNDPRYNALGASGAVSAVVFSFILFNPLHQLCLYGILCLPGILFGAGYLFYCYRMARVRRDNINHDAHLWGALYGFFFTIAMKPTLLLDFFSKLIYFRHAF